MRSATQQYKRGRPSGQHNGDMAKTRQPLLHTTHTHTQTSKTAAERRRHSERQQTQQHTDTTPQNTWREAHTRAHTVNCVLLACARLKLCAAAVVVLCCPVLCYTVLLCCCCCAAAREGGRKQGPTNVQATPPLKKREPKATAGRQRGKARRDTATTSVCACASFVPCPSVTRLCVSVHAEAV